MNRDITALIALIETRANRPFDWRGARDCVSFIVAGAEAQTGVDLLAGIPRWKSRREALAVAEQLGGLEAALDARLPRVPPALAQRGDIAGLIEDSAFGIRLMLVEGDTLVGPGTRGLERLPRAAMVLAWSLNREQPDG